MAIENDLVLIYLEDNPLSFARIESILPDSKPDWFHVKLLLLQIPPQVVTWILRDVYISGTEFTMNGKRMRLEKAPPIWAIFWGLDKKHPHQFSFSRGVVFGIAIGITFAIEIL